MLGASLLHAQAKKSIQVFGTVTDSLTGRPIYEATVEHYDLKGKRWSLTQNSDGRYALFIPAGKDFELRIVRENGYQNVSKRVKAAPKGQATYEVDLVMRPK